MAKNDNLLPSEVFLELRRRLIPVLLSFVIGFTLGIVFYRPILLLLLSLFDLSGINVVLTSSYQVFDLAINVGIVSGFMMLLPVLVYEFYSFVKPALKAREKRMINILIPISFLLFTIGFASGIKMTQFIFSFFSKMTTDFNVSNFLDMSKIVSQILAMGLLTGLVFQIPLIFSALIRLGLVKKQYLIKKRKFFWAILLVIAVLLPSTDIFSLIAITIPLVLLFELAILLNR